MYEIILVIFGLSLVAYVLDFWKKNWHIKQSAYWLLCIAWVMQTAVLVYEVIQSKSLPILTLIDVIYVYAWVLLTFSLLMNRFFHVQFVAFCTNVFSFIMLSLAVGLDVQQQGLNQSAHFIHEILVAHITFTILAYAFFTLSFFLSIMYLFQYWLLRKKKGFPWIWRITDLKQLDAYSFTAISIGVPLLSVGLFLGFVWAYTSGSEFYWMDMKTMGSMILLGIYMVYLMLRLTQGYRGKPISLFNTATFLVLLVNFFLFSVLSNFHF